ncbi:MAG: heavy-metal-associated domain-containing protein [Bacteroidales bacterium]|nr:heavy-metal-associated domain-containing protein [Bacteroidales bacterium]
MRKVLSLMVVALMSVTLAFAGNVKVEKFKVYGACGMCEKRIEKAVSAVEGVESADWNKETQMLEVKYNEETTNLKTIHIAVATVGHDTDKLRAKDEVYNKLHNCCKYERPATKSCCSGAAKCGDKAKTCGDKKDDAKKSCDHDHGTDHNHDHN